MKSNEYASILTWQCQKCDYYRVGKVGERRPTHCGTKMKMSYIKRHPFGVGGK